MPFNREDVLCRYLYDPLDQLVGTTPILDTRLLRFYRKSRLVTEVQGAVQCSIFKQDDQLLAQRYRQGDVVQTSLLATNQTCSILQLLNSQRPSSFAYSPYGYRPTRCGLLSLLGFNGERADSITGYYLLGNGYRAFNPVLMRFNSPDSLSPFGKGGLNSYSYCLGDPINRTDETGHFSLFNSILSMLKRKPKMFKNLESYSIDDDFQAFLELEKRSEKKPLRLNVASENDLVDLKPGESAKFVLTENKKFIVGLNVEHQKFMSHSALTGNEKNVKVISAGYISKELDGSVILNNISGHYKPNSKSLDHVKKYIEKNKIARVSKLIRVN
jgi:RHS repeat-associated protein